MARFYGEIQGNKGMAYRCSPNEIKSLITGWNNGIEVVGRKEENIDIFEVSITKGTNNSHTEHIFTLKGNEIIFGNPDIQILNELSKEAKELKGIK